MRPRARRRPGFLAASASADDPSLTAAEATAATLREMNPFGEVRVKPSAPVDSALSAGGFAGIAAETIAGHDAVLVCGAPLLERERINDLARETGAKFFAGSCRGSSADFFVDLGDAFEYVVKSRRDVPRRRPGALLLHHRIICSPPRRHGVQVERPGGEPRGRYPPSQQTRRRDDALLGV